MKKTFKILSVVLIFVIIAILWFFWRARDRYPGYEINLSINNAEDGLIKAGFAAIPVTPVLEDTWVDVNNDFQFKKKDGDTWEDRNGNGKFDACWIAGFHGSRAAQVIHDDLWARAVVVDDGKTRLAMVSVDVIGLFHTDVIEIRALIPEDAGITYTTVSSTHTHQGHDLLGLWGPHHFKTGVNKAYKARVISTAAKAVFKASKNMRPAKLHFAVNPNDASALVADTRDPQVFDNAIKIMHVIDAETDTTLGILVNWGCHPETTWNEHLRISSDFPHYLRFYLENGIKKPDSVIMKGYGGTAVFIAGCIGGLMTTSPDITITDPVSKRKFSEPSFQKADAQGKNLAMLIDSTLRTSGDTITKTSIQLHAKTIKLPIDNNVLKLGVILKVIDRGFYDWYKVLVPTVKSEIAAFTIGDAFFMTVPGEIYPEIVYGGIEAPEGQDFNTKPVEVPPLESMMPGTYHFILGLTNDEIGYIIPKSEWDRKPPYLYGSSSEHYGEINSLGPETAPILHSALKEVLSGF